MGDYVELPGVRTWYETDGAGDPLLLLHGGFCTNETWGAQRAEFAARLRVLLPERRGHGRTPDVDGPLSYRDMADDTVAFIESVVDGPAHLVGWSDGGVVALLVAVARPDLVRKVVAMGANFLPNPQSGAAPEMLEQLTPDAPDMAVFREMYEAVSPDGAAHWPVVVGKMVEMFRTEPVIPLEDLGRISTPTLVLVGDDDLITLEHTIALYRAIPGSELAVVPGTSHALLMEKPADVNRIILDFLANEPIPTMFPIRRYQGAAPESGTPA
ncbi:alpha/beta fold hydrolase [Streptomyces sp. NBC_01092]|uniref:alpha/beta fold hydrolase n=1 Tax=Streptomyces sp. NBC_01092 TaxID=2903748 RepID=UPI00386EA9E6|nr:alpha/beta hydrolase [Streptomyces sp. NBC_01092]